MNKKVEIEYVLRRAANQAQDAWLDYLRAFLAEVGPQKLESASEEGKGFDIYTQDENHNYVYHCYFDAVESVNYHDELVFMFHVQDGDGLFTDNSWVFDNEFADLSYIELFDGIVWSED